MPSIDDDLLSQASGEDFNYSHMSSEERSLFTKVMFRWFSKAANDQLALLVDGWTKWRKVDKFLKTKAQNSMYQQRSDAAADTMRATEPDNRTTEDLTVLYAWGKLTPVFESIDEVTIRTLFKKTKVRDLQQGEPLFYQGDAPDAFWIVLTGSLSLFVLKNKDEERRIQRQYRTKDLQALCLTQELLTGALGKQVGTVGSGSGIGELSLLGLGSKDRACAAVAAEPTCMIMLDTLEYNRFLRKGHMARMDLKSKVDFVLSVHIFSHWRREDVNRLVYGLKDVELVRGTKLLEVGQNVNNLIMIKEGSVSLTHPRGDVNLALLGARDLVGNDALYKHLAHRRVQVVEPMQSRFNVTAETTVTGYQIEVEELAKFCTGGHGLRTHKVLSTMLKLQERQRRAHFKRARKWQKKRAAEKQYQQDLKKGLLHRLEEEKERIGAEKEAKVTVNPRRSFESSDSSLESLGLGLGSSVLLSPMSTEMSVSPLNSSPVPVKSLPVIGVGGKQYPFMEPVASSSVAWAAELNGSNVAETPERPDSVADNKPLGSGFIRIRDRHLPTLVTNPKGASTIKEIPLPVEDKSRGLAATSGWEAKAMQRLSSRGAESAPLEERIREASRLLSELKKPSLTEASKSKRQKVVMIPRPGLSLAKGMNKKGGTATKGR